MSADNGVYILKTKDQYRVAHLQAIENLSWSAIDGRWDFSEKEKERYVPTRVMEMWGGCKYTRNREVAFQIAQRMVRNLRICEYGIHVITYNKTWRRIAEDGIRQKGSGIYPQKWESRQWHVGSGETAGNGRGGVFEL